MFAAKHYPRFITPRDLDNYLARGWYRMGQTIFTTHFLYFDEQFYSAIWIRQPLEGYTFRKSLRKIMRKCEKNFRYEFKKLVIDEEKENLYYRYRMDFPGIIAPSLLESLQDSRQDNIYETYEFCVYDVDKLIAASFFDLGHDSTASILGIYDPEYKPFSLGIYTMLMEMAFSIEQGFKYYYPGYVVPGYSRFAYKLRSGSPEYYDLRSDLWLPYEELKPQDIPINRMERKLQKLQKSFWKNQLGAELLYYPLFEANLFGMMRVPYFDYPVLLLCSPREDMSYYVVVFDPRKQTYQLMICSRFDDIRFFLKSSFTDQFKNERYFSELITADQVLFSSKDPEEIARALQMEAGR